MKHSRPKPVPKPSKLYIDLKEKYRFKTEYIKKYSSPVSKHWNKDRSHLWVKIIKEKLNEDNGTISYKIYKKCFKEISMLDGYRIRFLCLVVEMIYPVNQVFGQKVWEDLLETIDSFRGVGNYTFSPIIDFVEISIRLNKIDDNKTFIINAIEGAMGGCSDEKLNQLLSKIYI